jgi:predicted PurR-regulated permease PerM
MFYFFRDGDRIVQRVMYLSPLDKRYEQMFVDRLISVARATLRGSLVVGLVQGSIGALTLWAAGAKAPLLWGVVMMFTAMIPMLGTWIILYPNAIVLYSQGHVVGGTVVVLMTALVITNVDNVIRPRLVGKRARMHDLLVFFSTLGGIAAYGIFGFIVGPIIAALLMALLEIYALEFKHQLDFSHADGAAAEANGLTG